MPSLVQQLSLWRYELYTPIISMKKLWLRSLKICKLYVCYFRLRVGSLVIPEIHLTSWVSLACVVHENSVDQKYTCLQPDSGSRKVMWRVQDLHMRFWVQSWLRVFLELLSSMPTLNIARCWSCPVNWHTEFFHWSHVLSKLEFDSNDIWVNVKTTVLSLPNL
jgi:hypothetical protein